MGDTIGGGIGVAIVIAFVVIGWALLQKPVRCEKCGALQPKFRQPTNTKQAMFGGTTCASCGAELDTKGRVRN